MPIEWTLPASLQSLHYRHLPYAKRMGIISHMTKLWARHLEAKHA